MIGGHVSNCRANGLPKSAIYTKMFSGDYVAEGGGAGVAVISGARLEITDVSFTNCWCGNMGSAVFAQGSGTVALITRATMEDSYAGAGSTVFSTVGASVLIKDSTIARSTSGFTSGPYASPDYGYDFGGAAGTLGMGAAMYVEGSTIANCTAAVYLGCGGSAFGSHFEFVNSKCRGGTAGVAMGGICITSQATGRVEGSEIDGAQGAAIGGGLTLGAATATIKNTIIKNSVANTGAGIWASNGGDYTLDNVQIEGCTASDTGGGLTITNGAKSALKDVSVRSSTAVSGGGMYIAATVVVIDGVDIDACNADETGGGLYVGSGSVVSASALKVSNSRTTKATGSGGGMAVAGGTVELTGGSMVRDCAAPAKGGLLEVSGDGTVFTATDSFFMNGEAAEGGAISTKGSTDTLFVRSVVEKCTAAGGSGGCFVHASDSKLHFIDSTLQKGVTMIAWGGLGAISAGTVTFTRSLIHDGKTEAASAGCFTLNGGLLEIYDSTMDKCWTPVGGGDTGTGGCVKINAGKLDVRDSTVSQCIGKMGAAFYVAALGSADVFNTSIIGAGRSTGAVDNGIHIDSGGELRAAHLTFTPKCADTSMLPFIVTSSPMVMDGLRALTIAAPTCTRRALGAMQQRAIMGGGASLPTCSSNPSVCGKRAHCSDQPISAGANETSPHCSCIAPKVPDVKAFSALISPYVDGCRNVCPGGQVVLPGVEGVNGEVVCGCRAGLFLEKDGEDDADAGVCTPCALGSWSTAGASKCSVCMPGSYKLLESSPVHECMECPEGAQCPTNTLMSTLIVKEAHWRLGVNTSSIRRCVVGENGTTPCIGGGNASVDGVGYCLSGHHGALCQTCLEKGYAFIAEEGKCTLCPEVGGVAGQVAGLVSGVLAVFLLVVVAYRAMDVKELPRVQRWTRWFFGVATALNPVAKFKIIYAFLQIVLMMPEIYGVWVPPEYYRWMKVFSWLQFNIIDLAPAACLGDFTDQLIIIAMSPLAVMLIVVAIAVVWALARDFLQSKMDEKRGKVDAHHQPPSLKKSLKSGLALGITPAIIIAFCVLPSVSSSLFKAFDCEKFMADDATGEAQYFLASALSTRCSMGEYVNPIYDKARATALGLLLVWPLGMPLVTILAMISTRRALLAKRGTFWTRALGFLHREYRAECYWWEVVEMGRRLLLTGFVFLVLPPAMETVRLLFAQVLTLISLCAVALIQPYKRADNNTLAFAANLMLLLVLILSSNIKVYKDSEDAIGASWATELMGFSDPFSFSLVVFVVCVLMTVLMLGFMLLQARAFIKKRRQQMRDAICGLTRFKYSLNVVHFSKFVEAGRLVTHEEMRDAGALTVFDLWDDALTFAQSKTIVFFSHQWLGWSEPDPNNVHFPVMVQAVLKLLQRFGHKSEDVYIWIDYSSIPQKNKSAQLAAIDSIANYAALSKYFVVTAPDTVHADTGLACDANTYLGRGWCRLEQWAGMAASSTTDHLFIYEKDDLYKLSERPKWIEESVNVFTGKFTCNSDKDKLVDVVLSLYAFCIACGRYKPPLATDSASTKRAMAEDAAGQLWLSALIDANRKHIFPPEWFGDSVEILESDIEKVLEGHKSQIFSEADYHKLLRARQELCLLHGSELPDKILRKFASALKARDANKRSATLAVEEVASQSEVVSLEPHFAADENNATRNRAPAKRSLLRRGNVSRVYAVTSDQEAAEV